jgi:CRP/FNR family transcriptional regulator, anaerobic regulatory protein
VVLLSDASRQILSFLLPGDLVSTALLFEPRSHCLVEAITDVVYRTFKRSELKATLLKHPEMFDMLSQAWIEEKDRADQLIVDLGRRTADERIARLILNLAERLSQRDMIRTTENSAIEMEFPLRQHHIADATGLTPVHVSKVLSEFRRGGLIKISDRSLTILDPAGFRRVANMR